MLLELPYPVANNVYYRHFNGRTVLSSAGKQFKQEAAWIAKAAGVKVLSGDIEMTVIYHPKMNKDGSASKTRQDLDGILKGLCDSLNGVAYVDDKQLVRLIAEVGSAKKNGGLTVSIREV